MTKITLSDVSNILGNPTSAANTINANNDVIVAALDLLVSRDGETPNQMTADLDLDNNDLLNAGTVNADNIVLNGSVLVPSDVTSIPPGSVTTAFIADGAVTNPKLATDAVTQSKIADGAVGTNELLDSSITDAKVDATSALSRRVVEEISPFDPAFGADGGVADDLTEIQAAWDAGAAATAPVHMNKPLRASDELKTSSALHLIFANNAWLFQTGVSTTGSFITNLRNNSNDAATIQTNILIENPQVDGSLYPAAEVGLAQAGGAATITLAPGASAADDFYNGLMILILNGTGAAQTRFISDYVGSTKVATVTVAWTTPPDGTSTYQIGFNDNAFGFAAGMKDITIRGGVIKNFPHLAMTAPPLGAKGVNFEQGVTNGLVEGTYVENCGTAFFVQGLDGVLGNGETKRTTPVQVKNVRAKNCGSALSLFGIDTAVDPQGDSDDMMVLVDGLTFENCGHSPYRITGTDQQKSGAVNFGEANNVRLDNIVGRNASTYPNTSPGYPTDYSGRVGFGLSGDIGAWLWGWGRNVNIGSATFFGAADAAIRINRCRALGDDAGGTGIPQNCFGWFVENLQVHGTLGHFVRIDSNASFRVAANEFTGYIRGVIDSVSTGIVDSNMSTFVDVIIDVTERGTGKRIIGTPAAIIAAGNTFASFNSGTTDLRDMQFANLRGKSITLADDTAIGVVPPANAAAVMVIAQSATLRFLFTYRVSGSSDVTAIGTLPANCAIDNTSGTLTGTTGTDGNFTIRAQTGGNVYFENRRGGAVTFTATFIGGI